MVETQGTDVFDIPAEARRRGLDEHELMHFVFEHGVSAGLRMAECQRDRARPVDRVDENVFDLPAVARRMGWDEHELMHMVFEFGEEEGMRKMAEFSEDDASSVVFQGGVVQEPRVCLALDELIPVTEVRQACEAPEPAKSVQILFRGEHGLGVWKLAAEQSLADWYSGGGRLEIWVGTLPPLEGRSLTREVGLVLWGLGAWQRWSFIGGFWVVVLVAWSKVVAFRGLGSGRALIVARLIVGVRGTAAGVGFLGTLMAVAWGRGFLGLVPAKVVVCQAFRVRGRGWDEWCEIGRCSWPRSDVCVGGESHAQERQW